MLLLFMLFFFFTTPPLTEIYTLSLHDALPILPAYLEQALFSGDPESDRESIEALSPMDVEAIVALGPKPVIGHRGHPGDDRSEEHTSELQSQSNLVCRLLLEKKKTKQKKT